MLPFQDNHLAMVGPDLLTVERVYCLLWDRFGEAEWAALDRIYRRLPGEVQYRDVPYWFGSNESVPPHLSASVEPSGLQVSGVLPPAAWQAWDTQFRAEAASLPSFAV